MGNAASAFKLGRILNLKPSAWQKLTLIHMIGLATSLSSFTSGAQETADQTQALMKAAAFIIASKTGRTMKTCEQDPRPVCWAHRSDRVLGVYVNVSMLRLRTLSRSSPDKSWSSVDFRSKQQFGFGNPGTDLTKRYGDTLADTTQTNKAQFPCDCKT